MPDRPFIIPDVRRIAVKAFLAGQRYAVSRMQGKLRQMPPHMPPNQIIDELIAEGMEKEGE